MLKQMQFETSRSYFLVPSGLREAVLIDPIAKRGVEYKNFLAEGGFRLGLVLTTDQTRLSIEEERDLEAELGLAMGRFTQDNPIRIGQLEFVTLPVNGKDSPFSYLSIKSLEILFTHKLPGAHGLPLDVLSDLPVTTTLFPGDEESDLIFSTLEMEQRKAQLRQSGKLPEDDGVDRTVAISVDKFKSKLQNAMSDSIVIDVRDPVEYRAGHIPGTRNIPMSEVGLSLKELSQRRKIYLVCQTGRRSHRVGKNLTDVGLSDVTLLTGGLQAWLQAGYPIEKS